MLVVLSGNFAFIKSNKHPEYKILNTIIEIEINIYSTQYFKHKNTV